MAGKMSKPYSEARISAKSERKINKQNSVQIFFTKIPNHIEPSEFIRAACCQ